jgi:glycosyltransferase involved in cell wall biosynthesis
MGKNLRISLVTETYLPQVNGVSRTLDRLVNYCAEQGDRIQLLMPSYKDNPTTFPSVVERSEWPSLTLPFYREVLLPLTTVARVERVLADFRPDLVHIATEGPLGRAALLAARRLRLPTVSSYHTNFAQYLQNYHAGFLAPLCWRYLSWFHNATLATFCPTLSIQHLLEKKGFRNVGIWSRGVDSHRFHPGKRDNELRRSLGIGPDDILSTCVGRIAGEKNLEMLLQAWKMLPNRNNRFLLLIGDGPLRERLERGNDPHIIFVGYRYGEELAQLYASSDLFVFPSLSETFGNVILEAMASGLPVVGFKVQGPGDIIYNGRTGLFAEDISAAALSAAMQGLFDDNQRRRDLGRNARDYATTQTWQNIMADLRRKYVFLLGKNHSPSSELCGGKGVVPERQITRSKVCPPDRILSAIEDETYGPPGVIQKHL